MAQDTNGKVTTSQLDIKKESQEVSPLPAGDNKASSNSDHFRNALTDSEIRLRVREFDSKTLADAEKSALRVEPQKNADKQLNRIVGQIETN